LVRSGLGGAVLLADLVEAVGGERAAAACSDLAAAAFFGRRNEMVHLALIDRLWINLDQVGCLVPPSMVAVDGDNLPSPGVWIGGVYHVLTPSGYHRLLKYLAPDMVPEVTSIMAMDQLTDEELDKLQDTVCNALDQRGL